MKKLVRNLQKVAEKKNGPKKRNGKILNTFGQYIFLLKQLKLCKFRRFATSHSFFNYFSLIFQICTVQWINCTILKYERNRSYNGGGVVYVLKVRHLDQHDSILILHKISYVLKIIVNVLSRIMYFNSPKNLVLQ